MLLSQIFSLLTLATLFILAECDTPYRKSRLPPSREEEDMERYKKPFRIMFIAIILSVAPPLLQFLHCLFTDPAVPIVIKEMTLRGMEMMKNRFGLFERQVGGSISHENEALITTMRKTEVLSEYK